MHSNEETRLHLTHASRRQNKDIGACTITRYPPKSSSVESNTCDGRLKYLLLLAFILRVAER